MAVYTNTMQEIKIAIQKVGLNLVFYREAKCYLRPHQTQSINSMTLLTSTPLCNIHLYACKTDTHSKKCSQLSLIFFPQV